MRSYDYCPNDIITIVRYSIKRSKCQWLLACCSDKDLVLKDLIMAQVLPPDTNAKACEQW